MEYIQTVILALVAGFYFFNRSSFSSSSRKVSKAKQNAELIKVLLNLDEESLDQLFELYRQEFGEGAARYARQTYGKWKAGKVHPNRETFRRFLLYLPKVMSFDLKCEVLRELREAYCSRDNHQLIPQGQALFPMTADDIVDNALQNLDERQAREVTKKAADEIVKLAVEKRKAEYRSDRAQEEMRNLINNANLLDQKVDDFKINSTFETATGTTSVEIKKSRSNTLILITALGILRVLAIIIFISRM